MHTSSFAADTRYLREPASLFGEELDRMQTALTSAPWLAGDAVSAADLTVFRYPAVAAWVERVQRLPGYDRTYPPHWR